MNTLWLAIMLSMAPRAPRENVAALADAIVAATPDVPSQALLVTVALYETGLGRGGVPFGLTCCWRRGWTTDQAAARSLRILRQPGCNRPVLALGHYHHGGGCRADALSRREARMARRLLRLYRARELASTASPP